MLSSAEKAGFCVTSEQAAAAQWSGKLNIYGKHNEEDMMSVLESACSFFFEGFSVKRFTVKALM